MMGQELTVVLDVDDITNRVAAMVQADPEAFGLLPDHEPRLGCATTAQLLMELDARLGASIMDDDDGQVLPDFDAVRRRGEINDLRNGLTGEQLAYRTIDN